MLEKINSTISIETSINIITLIISIVLAFFTIRKFYFDISKKRELHDFEIINKYFCKENIKQLREESKIIQDMACRSLFSFKGLNFEEIDNLLSKNNIGFYEIKNITTLRRNRFLNSNLSKNHKYRTKIGKYLFSMFVIFVFIIYITAVLFLYAFLVSHYPEKETILHLSLLFTVGIPEIVMFICIDRKWDLERSISWFNERSEDFSQIITI